MQSHFLDSESKNVSDQIGLQEICRTWSAKETDYGECREDVRMLYQQTELTGQVHVHAENVMRPNTNPDFALREAPMWGHISIFSL